MVIVGLMFCTNLREEMTDKTCGNVENRSE